MLSSVKENANSGITEDVPQELFASLTAFDLQPFDLTTISGKFDDGSTSHVNSIPRLREENAALLREVAELREKQPLEFHRKIAQ